MKGFLNWLSRKRFPYEPLITITLSKGRLLDNLNKFRKLIPDGEIAPVLKSNAYGHGLQEIASMLANEPHIPFFIVDSYFEAVALRAKGVRKPLLVIGYTRPSTIMESDLGGVAFTVTSIDTLTAIKDVTSRVYIHVKIDTGMHRQGILMDEVPHTIELLKKNPNIGLLGICTHLCDADNADPTFTEAQIDHWNNIVLTFKNAFPDVRYIHASATDGSRFSARINGNVMRLGLGLYGLSENENLKTLNLQPVLEMTTILTGLKMLLRNETVGYGNTFKAKGDITIATIPVGYYEGLDRRLSNNGFVLVGDRKIPCPIIGRVSMNISTLDVSAIPPISDLGTGMPVTVISNDAGAPNSISSLAKRCGTIDYETVVRIPPHLKRVAVD